MKKYLNVEYATIFVILGKGCNMRCKYCLQTPYNRQEVGNKDLPLVADFIRDAAQNQRSPLHVQFFGGEPLMYINDLKKLVRVCKKEPNITFGFISNGTLLTEDLVQYFNDHNFHCGISWDGPGSIDIRGKDIFSVNKQNVMGLNRLGISSIVSAYCYPKDLIDAYAKLSDEYQAIHGHPMNFCIEEFLDTGVENCNDLLANKEKLCEQMTEMCRHYKLAASGQDHNSHYAEYITGQLGQIRQATNSKYMIPLFSRCGDGTRVVNIDLAGNLYKCHNHEVIIGHVNGNFWDVMEGSIRSDHSFPYKHECVECYVAPLCRGGCALIEQHARKSMCDLHLAFYSPVIDLVMEQVK